MLAKIAILPTKLMVSCHSLPFSVFMVISYPNYYWAFASDHCSITKTLTAALLKFDTAFLQYYTGMREIVQNILDERGHEQPLSGTRDDNS